MTERESEIWSRGYEAGYQKALDLIKTNLIYLPLEHEIPWSKSNEISVMVPVVRLGVVVKLVSQLEKTEQFSVLKDGI